MTATIHHLPPIPAEPAPPWDEFDTTVIKIAESQRRHGVTVAEAFEAASRYPEYRPVAEAMAVLEASRQ